MTWARFPFYVNKRASESNGGAVEVGVRSLESASEAATRPPQLGSRPRARLLDLANLTRVSCRLSKDNHVLYAPLLHSHSRPPPHPMRRTRRSTNTLPQTRSAPLVSQQRRVPPRSLAAPASRKKNIPPLALDKHTACATESRSRTPKSRSIVPTRSPHSRVLSPSTLKLTHTHAPPPHCRASGRPRRVESQSRRRVALYSAPLSLSLILSWKGRTEGKGRGTHTPTMPPPRTTAPESAHTHREIV